MGWDFVSKKYKIVCSCVLSGILLASTSCRTKQPSIDNKVEGNYSLMTKKEFDGYISQLSEERWNKKQEGIETSQRVVGISQKYCIMLTKQEFEDYVNHLVESRINEKEELKRIEKLKPYIPIPENAVGTRYKEYVESEKEEGKK